MTSGIIRTIPPINALEITPLQTIRSLCGNCYYSDKVALTAEEKECQEKIHSPPPGMEADAFFA
jgi:hypothetical protein